VINSIACFTASTTFLEFIYGQRTGGLGVSGEQLAAGVGAGESSTAEG
jgi:hypothetical protein